MSAQLSRKYAWLDKTPSIRALSYEKFIELASSIEKADSFEDLPAWVKNAIGIAEKEKPANK
jgi:hypothetical protein